jgi:hypothetical protein
MIVTKLIAVSTGYSINAFNSGHADSYTHIVCDKAAKKYD